MTTKALPSTTEPAAEPPPHNDDELLAMARMLRRGKGTFVLAFARCNAVPQRETLVARLKDAVELFGVKPIELTLTSDDLTALPERLQAAASDGQPLFVYGLDQVMPSAHPEAALAQLNHRRAKFGHIDSPVVLWLPEYVLRLIAQHAPDFWSWRSGVYDFEPEAEISVPLYRRAMDEPYLVMTSLDRADKEQRLHLLMGLLDDYEGDAPALARVRSSVLFKIAELHRELGNYDVAERYYQQCLEIERKLKDRHGVATAQNRLAFLYRLRGDYNQAERLYQQSLATFLELSDRQAIAVTQAQLADIYQLRGDYEQAERLYQQSLATLLELGDQRAVAVTQGQLADLYVKRGDYDQAEQLYQQSLATSLELGDRREVAVNQHSLADLYRLRGDYEQAERLYRQSLMTAFELGDRQSTAVTQGQLAKLYQLRGDYDQAERLYQQSLTVLLELGDRREAAVTLHNWGSMEQQRGDVTKALDLFTRSRQLFAEIGLDKDVEEEDAAIIKLKSQHHIE